MGMSYQQGPRRVRRQRKRSRPRTRPTPAQKELDRQAALEALASLKQAVPAGEASGRKSDNRTHFTDSDSHHSDEAPRVTPQTADDDS
ncbi:hypothetical protein NDU88_006200 [Pleurodeles waltl]|uniref:Uncharacterized protein n=1 Tax=Pleurodeles waltl TaxID=8319 RepID=A0AAV7X043_PLEWA|nr:hypothetical protein NDU88_006200 [Pleurodeles waltl]